MGKHDKRVIAQFTVQSKHFNSSEYSLSSQEYLKWAVERMPLPKEPDGRVLDVAAGTGLLSFAVSPHAGSIVAVDITEAMLEEGRRAAAAKGITNVTFRLGDAYELSAERGYDMAMSRLAFHHLKRPGDVLGQMAGAVKPGGSVVVLDIVSPNEREAAKAYNRYERLRDDSHVRALTECELIRMYEENSLCDVKVHRRSVINELEAWMRMTQTSGEKRDAIREAVQRELNGGNKTGLSPFMDAGGAVKFIHSWAMVTGRTPHQ